MLTKLGRWCYTTFFCQGHGSYFQHFPLRCSFNYNVETQSPLSFFLSILVTQFSLPFDLQLASLQIGSHQFISTQSITLPQLMLETVTCHSEVKPLNKNLLTFTRRTGKLPEVYFTMSLIKGNHQDLAIQKKAKGFSCTHL